MRLLCSLYPSFSFLRHIPLCCVSSFSRVRDEQETGSSSVRISSSVQSSFVIDVLRNMTQMLFTGKVRQGLNFVYRWVEISSSNSRKTSIFNSLILQRKIFIPENKVADAETRRFSVEIVRKCSAFEKAYVGNCVENVCATEHFRRYL